MQKEIIGKHILYCGDCYEIMPEFQDEAFDMLLTDPPYEFISKNPRGGGFYKNENKKHFEEIKDNFGMSFNPLEFLQNIRRLIKKGAFNAYIFTNKNLIKEYITFAEENSYKWDLLIWNKINPVPAFYGHYMTDKEYRYREESAVF